MTMMTGATFPCASNGVQQIYGYETAQLATGASACGEAANMPASCTLYQSKLTCDTASASCTGTDDGNSAACALNGNQMACAVADPGHNCIYSAACVWDAAALGGSGRCEEKTNACTGVSDLDWARSFAIETATSASLLEATVAVDVSAEYRDAVVSADGALALEKLRSSLREAIGAVLLLPSYDVAIISVVNPVASGRRQLQANSQLSLLYEVTCTHCGTCAAVATTETACVAAAGGNACSWTGSACVATITQATKAEPFGKAVLSAFLYSTSVCCPTTATGGGVGPTRCAAAGSNTLPAACIAGAFGSAAVISTVDTLTAALPTPTMVTIDANEINSLQCAADREWGSSTAELSAASQNAHIEIAATCTGTDDGSGTSTACALSGDETACAVTDTGHSCVYTPAVVIDYFEDEPGTMSAEMTLQTGDHHPMNSGGDSYKHWAIEATLSPPIYSSCAGWDCEQLGSTCTDGSGYICCREDNNGCTDGSCWHAGSACATFPEINEGVILTNDVNGLLTVNWLRGPLRDSHGVYTTDATTTYKLIMPNTPKARPGCLFGMVMDGLCQCDCIQEFTEDLCGLNDAASGDCTGDQVGKCNGLAVGTALPCDFYDNPPSCNAHGTGCEWDGRDFGCGWAMDEMGCTMYDGCIWDIFQCIDPPRCAVKKCETNQHVVSEACADCPANSYNHEGDSPADGNTPCRTDLWASPCHSFGGVTLTGSESGTVYFTNSAPMQFSMDFALGDRGNYQNGLDCSWTLVCPANTKPTLTFTSFATEGNFDFVALYDGTSDMERQLARGSGDHWSSGDVTATGQNMYVRFTSDGSVSMAGFQATYACAARRRLEYDNTTVLAIANLGAEFKPNMAAPRWQSVHPRRALLTNRADSYESREIPASFVTLVNAEAWDEETGLWVDSFFESYRRRLGRAAALAPRVIPDDFLSTATATVVAAPTVMTPPPPPPPVINISASVALAPASALGLGGFTPSCPGKPSGDMSCDDGDVQFMYFMEITQDQEVARIQRKIDDTLLKGLWIDPQTRVVELSFAAYNGNLGLFSVVTASFNFALGGEVSKGFAVTVLDLELVKSEYEKDDGTLREYGTAADTMRITMEFVVVIGVIYLAGGELKDLWEAKQVLGKYRYYFSSMWNAVDLLHITLYVMAIFYWILMFTMAQDIVPPQYFDWSDPEKLKELLETTDQILNQAALYDMYRVLNIANLFVVLVLVFKFTRFQGRLAVINDTLSIAGEPLFHFGIIFGVCIFVYSVMGKVVFGAQVAEYSNLEDSFHQNFNGAMGAWDMFPMRDVAGIWGLVFYYSYTFLVFFTLINFFLAIVMEAYDDANSKASEATSVLSDMGDIIEHWTQRIFHRNKVDLAMETDDDGNHDFDMGMLLDERVVAVLQQIRYSSGMKTADAGLLRKAIVAKFIEEPDDGKTERESAVYGTEIANALVLWYFEDVDPEAAPEAEEDDVGGKVQEVSEQIDALKEQVEQLLERG